MSKQWNLSEQDKALCAERLCEQLPVLRARAGLSQGELSRMVGISRQTYSAAENGTRPLSWEACLALLCFFDCNRDTHAMLHDLGAYPTLLKERFCGGTEAPTSDASALLHALDAQGRHTVRAVLLVEYARCTGQPIDRLLERFPTL